MNYNSAGSQLTENSELFYVYHGVEMEFLMSNDDFGLISQECKDYEYDKYDKYMAKIAVNNNQQNKPILGLDRNNDDVKIGCDGGIQVDNHQQNNDEQNELSEIEGETSLFDHYHYKPADVQQDVDYIFNRNINYDGGNNERIVIQNQCEIEEVEGNHQRIGNGHKCGIKEVGYLADYKPCDQVLKEIMMRFIAANLELKRQMKESAKGVIPTKERNCKRGRCDSIWD